MMCQLITNRTFAGCDSTFPLANGWIRRRRREQGHKRLSRAEPSNFWVGELICLSFYHIDTELRIFVYHLTSMFTQDLQTTAQDHDLLISPLPRLRANVPTLQPSPLTPGIPPETTTHSPSISQRSDLTATESQSNRCLPQ